MNKEEQDQIIKEYLKSTETIDTLIKRTYPGFAYRIGLFSKSQVKSDYFILTYKAHSKRLNGVVLPINDYLSINGRRKVTNLNAKELNKINHILDQLYKHDSRLCTLKNKLSELKELSASGRLMISFETDQFDKDGKYYGIICLCYIILTEKQKKYFDRYTKIKIARFKLDPLGDEVMSELAKLYPNDKIIKMEICKLLQNIDD